MASYSVSTLRDLVADPPPQLTVDQAVALNICRLWLPARAGHGGGWQGLVLWLLGQCPFIATLISDAEHNSSHLPRSMTHSMTHSLLHRLVPLPLAGKPQPLDMLLVGGSEALAMYPWVRPGGVILWRTGVVEPPPTALLPDDPACSIALEIR